MPRDREPIDVEMLDSIDDEAPLSSLTVGQFKEMVSFKERLKELHKLTIQRKQEMEEIRAIRDNTTSIFKDVNDLQMASTPFRIKNSEQLENFIQSCRNALNAGDELLLALGTRPAPKT